jgi:hypothetical protein
MAKKVTSQYKCGQCALAQWDESLTNKGERFLLRCPHYKEGKVLHFAKDTACKFFKP